MNIKSAVEQVEAIAKEHAKESQRNPEPTEYECAKCRDQGVVIVLAETREEIAMGDSRLWDENHQKREHTFRQCTCVERKRIERLFRSSHITDQFRSVGFRGFITDSRPQCAKQARDTSLDYYNRFDEIRSTRANSIVLYGPPGSGKTHLLMAIANGLMRKGVAVQYFPWVEGFNDLKDKLDDLQKRTEAMKHVEVLYIDDLYKGRQKPTDFMLEQLFGVVNYRYQNCLPMMVCSERTTQEIFAIDEAIGRRIHERSEGHRVLMGLTPEERAAGIELNYSLVEV